MSAPMRMLAFTAKGYNQLTCTERVSHARDTYGAVEVVVNPAEAPDAEVERVTVTTANYVPVGYLDYRDNDLPMALFEVLL